MNKEKLIIFNTITNILLLLILFLGGFVWADSNGVWHRAEDVKPGIFGNDEAFLSDFFIFNNTVRFFKFTQFNENVEINGNLSVNGNLNITNNLILDSIKNCQGKLITSLDGKIICDNFILNLTDMNPASFNYTRYKVCAENEHCSGTPILCAANAPDSAATMIASSLPIYWGSWSNSQCGTSGNGWYQSHSTCSSAVGNGYAKCNWVLVEINETIEGLFNDSSNEKPLAGIGVTIGADTRTVSIDTNTIQNRVSGTCAVGSYIKAINGDGSVVCGIDNTGTTSETDPQVGVLVAGKWCRENAGVVNCDQDPPSGGRTLAEATAALVAEGVKSCSNTYAYGDIYGATYYASDGYRYTRIYSNYFGCNSGWVRGTYASCVFNENIIISTSGYYVSLPGYWSMGTQSCTIPSFVNSPPEPLYR